MDSRFASRSSPRGRRVGLSNLGKNARVPIRGYGDDRTAGTAQLPTIEASSEDEAGKLALDMVRMAADTCNVVNRPDRHEGGSERLGQPQRDLDAYLARNG